MSNHRRGVSKNFFAECDWIVQNCRRLRGSWPALPDKKSFLRVVDTVEKLSRDRSALDDSAECIADDAKWPFMIIGRVLRMTND